MLISFFFTNGRECRGLILT